jgi:hypothetical protein
VANHSVTLLRLDDAPAWEALREGQAVVFLANARSEILLDSDGKPANGATSIPVFESIGEAEDYAERTVQRMPTVCAEIYDHRGRGGDPLERVYHESLRKHFDPERRARRYAWTGGCLLGIFAIWAVVAANRSNQHFLWFYLIGVKLLTLGTILFVRGMGFFIERRGGRTSWGRRRLGQK